MIVMLSGKQGSGKTSTAEALQKHWNSRGIATVRYRFAQPLYEMHEVVYLIAKNYGIEPPAVKDGDLLQVLGTEWGRRKDPNIWVNCAKNKIQEMAGNWIRLGLLHVVLLDDLRFENEFDAFPDAFRVRLECDREIRKQRASYWREREDHPSEIGLDEYAKAGKFTLTVDTGKLTLEQATAQIAEELTRRVEKAFAK